MRLLQISDLSMRLLQISDLSMKLPHSWLRVMIFSSHFWMDTTLRNSSGIPIFRTWIPTQKRYWIPNQRQEFAESRGNFFLENQLPLKWYTKISRTGLSPLVSTSIKFSLIRISSSLLCSYMVYTPTLHLHCLQCPMSLVWFDILKDTKTVMV